jgi:hypothetical protein
MLDKVQLHTVRTNDTIYPTTDLTCRPKRTNGQMFYTTASRQMYLEFMT